MTIFFFLTAVFGTYTMVNLYMFVRMYMTLSGSPLIRAAACAVFILFALAFPLSRLLGGHLPAQVTGLLATMASFYLAPMVYGFFITAIVDILRLLNYVVTITPMPPPFTLAGRVNTVFAVAAVSILISIAGAVNARFPTLVEHEVAWQRPVSEAAFLPQAPPIKIAMISDLHLGRMVGARHLKKIVDLTNAQNADIVLLVGDIIDDLDWASDEAYAEALRDLLKSLSPRLGVWAVTGNHEFYAGIDECVDFLASANVRLLRDEAAFPNAELLLVGREDRTILRFGASRSPIDEILARAADAYGEAARNAPVVLMDHQPFDLHEAEERGVALQLSGHTHKGQLVPFNLVVKNLYEAHYGLYKRGKTNYYISCGAATWGPPVRTSGRPEVAVIRLNIL